MINIKKFVSIRKKLGLSQTELSQGICTQATLSKFENLGRIPSIRIITQLCDRMNISLSDLMVDATVTAVDALFVKADFNLITYDYDAIRNILSQIVPEKLTASEKWHYNYLKGSLALYDEDDLVASLFYFNTILTDPEIDDTSIYYLLALSGCGQIYEKKNDVEKAEHYFNIVFDSVMHKHIDDSHSAIQILSILLNGGVFYAQKQDYDTSNSLLNYAYHTCSDNHITYYLARIIYQLAQNAIATKQPQHLIQEYISDARAFARLNNNTTLLQKIAALNKNWVAWFY